MPALAYAAHDVLPECRIRSRFRVMTARKCCVMPSAVEARYNISQFTWFAGATALYPAIFLPITRLIVITALILQGKFLTR